MHNIIYHMGAARWCIVFMKISKKILALVKSYK